MLARILVLTCSLCATPTTRTISGDARRADSTQYEMLYERLMHLTADEANIARVSNVVLRRDAGTFSLEKGHIMLCKPVKGRVLAALPHATVLQLFRQ